MARIQTGDGAVSYTHLVESLLKEGIKICMIPTVQEWDGKSDIDHTQLKEVDIEDLLPFLVRILNCNFGHKGSLSHLRTG